VTGNWPVGLFFDEFRKGMSHDIPFSFLEVFFLSSLARFEVVRLLFFLAKVIPSLPAC
jgi:hypothetical protein